MKILNNLKIIFIKHKVKFLSFFNKILRKFSIKTRIFACFSFILFFIVISIGLLIVNYQKNSIKSQYYLNLKSTLEALSLEVIDDMINFDPLRLDEKIELFRNRPEVVYMMIIDLNGKIIAHTEPINLGREISLDEEVFKKWEKLDFSNIRHLNVPIFSEDYPLGALRIGIKEEFVEKYASNAVKNLKNYLLIISGIFLLIVLVVSYLLSNTLTKPLQKLKDAIKNFHEDGFTLCENENLILCKDYYKCQNYECPAYGQTRCWLVENAKKVCKQLYNLDCQKCYVYRISCGDELGYLIETFNEMIIKLNRYMQELEKATQEKIKLERTSAVAEMAMVVAHEIKNPLNAIRAASSYLRENFKGKVLHEFLSIIDREVYRLNELITGFLSYARPVPLKLEKVNLNTVINEVINLIKTEIIEEKKELIVELDQNIPNLYLDPYQFKQAILNLLVNAQEATKEGDKIRVMTLKEDQYVKILVEDTGEGIPEEYLSKIFEPFFTTKVTGSGLGLACVERIIREHGGKIEVRSLVGKGTCFLISLPLRVEP